MEEKQHHVKTGEKTHSQTERVSLLKRRDKKSFTCTQCGKSFTTNRISVFTWGSTLERNLSCDQCGKSFTQSSTLKMHMIIHTGEKLHECDQCGKTFLRASNLNRHLKVHSKEKPHSCPFCGKTFLHLRNLKVHQKTHTGVRDHVLWVWEDFYYISTFETAPEDPHWRETLQVFTLRQEIQSVRRLENTWEDSHWRETVSLHWMREEFTQSSSLRSHKKTITISSLSSGKYGRVLKFYSCIQLYFMI